MKHLNTSINRRDAAECAHTLARFLDNLANGLAAEPPAEPSVSLAGIDVEEHQQAPVAREPRVKPERQRTVGDAW